MSTKKQIENERDQRIQALEKKFEHEQKQLAMRHEREKQMIERRYTQMLKTFDKKPAQPLH
jgi:hypothetical protein